MATVLDPLKALSLWHRVLRDGLATEQADLTTRQMAILLEVYMETPPHTVRGLSETLGMPKPAVTRALDRLGALGLVKRKRDETDRRSVLVQRTVKGSVFLRDFADRTTRLAEAL